jgi:hypothetical protein
MKFLGYPSRAIFMRSRQRREKATCLRNLRRVVAFSKKKALDGSKISSVSSENNAFSSFFPKLSLVLLALFLFFSAFSFAAEEKNLLTNGGFELDRDKNDIPDAWGTEAYNSQLVSPGKVRDFCLKIENKAPATSMGAQEIALNGEKIKRITMSSWLKIENVKRGEQTWEMAKLQIIFFDEKGIQVGGWPEVGSWEGTFDWKKVSRSFLVPRATRKIKITFGLLNSTGTVYFDDLRLTAKKPTPPDPHNLISNGDFEVWEGWTYGGTPGGGVVYPGYHGDGALYIHNDNDSWSFASQSVDLDGSKIFKIKISGNVKIENVVQGVRPWQKARINIEFKDKNGDRIGGWPIIGAWTGTFDWQPVEKIFEVPTETKRVDLYLGLLDCAGAVYFDDIVFEAYLSDGSKLADHRPRETDTSSWFAFNPKEDNFKPTITDVSFLLDAPAGKHGFLKVKDGHFYFEDGMRARFWGTNIVGKDCFPSKKTAELMAKRLAKYGCNLVRLHHMDAFWSDPNIFDKNYNDTQHFSMEMLDRLDYLIFQLKKQGIYIFLDLLVDREFKEGDGVSSFKKVERGAKFTGFYNKRIIELQKKYAFDLITHFNQYTRLRYFEEPAIVSVKLINEAMLFYISRKFDFATEYVQELDDLWNKWLIKKYNSHENLEKAWVTEGASELEEGEVLNYQNIKRSQTVLFQDRGGWEKKHPHREKDNLQFYYDLEADYFKEMANYLKSLGLKVPISGSNHWVNIAADVKANAVLDYIDRHRYWDHPQFGYGTEIVFENQPEVKFPEKSLIPNFAAYKIEGLPFSISEWNNAWPDEFRVEGLLIMAAYANLQDWDAVLQFNFSGENYGNLLNDNFDVGKDPIMFTQWPVASLIFHRGDVKTAKNILTEILDDEDVFRLIEEDKLIGGNGLIALSCAVQRKFVEGSLPAEKKKINLEKIKKLCNSSLRLAASDTKELNWDGKQGLITINTPNTQAAVGFLKNKSLNLSSLNLKTTNDFASISLTSPKDVISKSKNLLLTASSRSENTGMIYNSSKTQLKDVGSSPILFEPVNAAISIKNSQLKSAAVWALDINGDRIKKVPAQFTDGKLSFKISGLYKAIFYEISVK